MVAATVSARPSKFRVIVNGIKWLCWVVGAKLRSWWPGPPLAPGVSSRVPLPRNNGGYEEKRGGPRPRNTSGTRRTDIPRPCFPSRMSWQLTLASLRFVFVVLSFCHSHVSNPFSFPRNSRISLNFSPLRSFLPIGSVFVGMDTGEVPSTLLQLKNATLFELV